MARSSDMSTTMQYVKYYINCNQNSQSIVNNTSNVTVSIYIYRTNVGYPTWGTGTMYCTINGTQYSQGITPSQVFDNTPHVRVFSKTLDIPHNADGTKTLTMSAYVTHDMFTSSSQSYSQTLTTIARKSNPTLSASSTEMEKSVTINTNRASSSFTHTLKYTFGSYTGTIATGVGTSYAWTIPLSFANQVPNATSGTGTITCETYNGSTLIGSSNVTFTATVPSSVVPSFTSLGVTRVDGAVPSAWGIYVKGKSKATLTINGAVGSYTSTIISYSISGDGYSTTNSSFTTGFLNNAGTITFTATIKDSRGRTASKTASVTVVDYEQPKITNFTSYRANSSGTLMDSGTYIKCSATFSYSSVSSKNTIGANVKFRKVGVTSWTTGSNISSGTPVTTGGGTISVDSSYEVLLTVTDAFGSVTLTYNVSTSGVMLDFKSGGTGVAIGKVAETDNLFEVGWNTKINGTLNATNVQVGGNNVYHTGRKPSASDVGALASNGKAVSSTQADKVVTSNSGGIYEGTGDNASSTITNVQIKSWFGIGFAPSISGQTVPQNENAIWMNVRTGDISARNEVYAKSNKRTYHEGWCGNIPIVATRISNLNGRLPSGWYGYSSGSSGAPTSYGVVLYIQWGESADFSQIATDLGGGLYVRAFVNGAFTSWFTK